MQLESTVPSAIRAPDPARIVNEAINIVTTERRLTVSSRPELGVVIAASSWVPAPGAHSVSPLGAVLLVAQPQKGEPIAALVDALGVGSMWQEGFRDGCAKEPLKPNLQAGLDGRLYDDGYTAGVETRGMLRRIEVKVEQLMHDIKAEPMKLIPALLNSLLLSEVLDSLADLERNRAITLGGAAREIHQDAARILSDLAENFRADGL